MNTSERHFPFVVGFIAVGLGFAAGWAVSMEGPPPAQALELAGGEPGARRVEVPGEAGIVAPASGPAQVQDELEEGQPAVRRSAAGVSSDYFSAALLQHFDVEFRRAWSAARSGPAKAEPGAAVLAPALEEFKLAVLALPAAAGLAGATAANDMDRANEALQLGDGVGVVEACATKGLLFDEDDLSPEFFERVFRPRTSAATLAGSDLSATASGLADGTTIDFGPGMHRLDQDRLRREDGDSFPEDLTLIGAGMNRTLVTISNDIAPRGEARRLRIRDLTLDCGNNYLFDMRRGVLTIDLENVRIVRFDMGAGSSLVFGTSKGALVRARDCEFLGGFGHGPSSGRLFRGDALIATFHGCRFTRINLNLARASLGKILFDECVFEGFHADPTASEHATFRDATVLPLVSWAERHDRTQRSLTDFFPAWQAR